jgi:class 3 adenylate cyclase
MSIGEAIDEVGVSPDKFVGDAIAAIFWRPVMSANHAAEAVTAASARDGSRPLIANTHRPFAIAAASI